MGVSQKSKQFESRQDRIVFQEFVNDQGNLFGGNALKWMDEVAYIAAKQFTRQRMVTVSVERVKFLLAIPLGSMVMVSAKILSAGPVKLVIDTEIWLDVNQEPGRIKAIEGKFIFASVDEECNPKRLISTGQN
ncbi:MAG: acyl-CoA thioesterase [Bacteroidetes bacterium]|nr:acyl-CoA thioesterase [Bacteroidota bacterium]